MSILVQSKGDDNIKILINKGGTIVDEPEMWKFCQKIFQNNIILIDFDIIKLLSLVILLKIETLLRGIR